MLLPTNLVIAAGGVLSHEPVKSTGTTAEDHMLKVAIAGDLTINAGGTVDVTGLGYFGSNNGPGASGANSRGGHHGGLGGGISSGTTYDSVTNPVRCGSAGHGSGSTAARPGGGCALLSIGGALTLNGSILADGPLEAPAEAASSGSGGSVNITAGSLSGNGTISANGGGATSGGNQGGGGGRIAVVLTNASDSAFAALASILAYGGRNAANSQFGAAGTVCLKGTNTAYGRLIVDNNGRTPYLGTTLLNASTTDKTVGDVLIRNSATVVLADGETLTSYGSWSNAVAMSTNAASAYGGTVVFAGTAAATVWGGNTWSNLTIATAGKTMSFQNVVTQTVYGLPAFSNVTLQSTSPGAWWYLRKSGAGTQYVGRVTVQDSNATNGWTFCAPVGSVNGGHNVNWIFLSAKGTLFLLR